MQQNSTKNDNQLNRFVDQLRAEKKKVVMAACLLTLMVFMWARAFSDNGPKKAKGASSLTGADSAESNHEQIISFVKLPNIKGRNDMLTRDFFKVNDWRQFASGADGKTLVGIKEMSFGSETSGEETIKRVAEKIKLEAIGFGDISQAFINDKLLVVGDILPIKDAGEIYEFEVLRIEENAVFMKWGESEITLKLSQPIEMDD